MRLSKCVDAKDACVVWRSILLGAGRGRECWDVCEARGQAAQGTRTGVAGGSVNASMPNRLG